MEWERLKGEWKLLWKSVVDDWAKSLNELLAGISAKYKALTGISWMNVHRLYDSRRWCYMRFRLSVLRKGISASRRRSLYRPVRRNQTGATDSGT